MRVVHVLCAEFKVVISSRISLLCGKCCMWSVVHTCILYKARYPCMAIFQAHKTIRRRSSTVTSVVHAATIGACERHAE